MALLGIEVGWAEQSGLDLVIAALNTNASVMFKPRLAPPNEANYEHSVLIVTIIFIRLVLCARAP